MKNKIINIEQNPSIIKRIFNTSFNIVCIRTNGKFIIKV